MYTHYLLMSSIKTVGDENARLLVFRWFHSFFCVRKATRLEVEWPPKWGLESASVRQQRRRPRKRQSGAEDMIFAYRGWRSLHWENSIEIKCYEKREKGGLHGVWKSPKMSHSSFSILAFSNNFCPIKSSASAFQQIAKCLMNLWNVHVARFARNVECDFFCDFQTLWVLGE